MKVLVAGGQGQLGRQLQEVHPHGVQGEFRGRDQLDITDATNVREVVGEARPDVLINAAVMPVEACESNPDVARQINVVGPRNLAEACRDFNVHLIHLSTDYVFNGRGCLPYQIDDPTGPIQAYGRSKLEGEQAVFGAHDRVTVVRTAWLYSKFGTNFMRTMLRLMGERDKLTVIDDQVGTPTWAKPLAEFLWAMARSSAPTGIFHWTDAGVASWYDFAVAIRGEAVRAGLLDSSAARVLPISTAEYSGTTNRPHFSVLDKSKAWAWLREQAPDVRVRHWTESLQEALTSLT